MGLFGKLFKNLRTSHSLPAEPLLVLRFEVLNSILITLHRAGRDRQSGFEGEENRVSS